MNKAQILNNTPTAKSNAGDWISFHKSLVETIGKKNANEMFKNWWSKIGNSNANTGELRDYLKHNGINLSGDSILSDVVDFTYDVGDKVSSVMAVGKYAAIGLVALITIPLFIALLNVALHSGKITTNAVDKI